MKPRTIIIAAAAVVLAGGAILSAAQGPQPCRATSQGISGEPGREKLVGIADCERGTVALDIGGQSVSLSVQNHTFAAWIITENGRTVALQDVRG